MKNDGLPGTGLAVACLLALAGAAAQAAPGGNVLPNGVAVDNACGQPVNNAIVFSQDPAADLYHAFSGYGVNLQNPLDEATALRVLPDLQALNFRIVKTELGTPYKGDSFSTYPILPAPVGLADDAAMHAQISGPVAGFYPPFTLDLMHRLHASGIGLVSAMFAAPNSYVTADGAGNETIVDADIPDFTKFYAAYLHTLADLGIVPDYAETENEPNGAWGTKWSTDQFARMMTGLQFDLFHVDTAVSANLVSSGTSTYVHFANDYLGAIDARAAGYVDPDTARPYPDIGIGGMKALTLHAYYITQAPNNGGVPPADDPAFHSFYERAKAAGIPLIVTEFGGTNFKSKQSDPNAENVNPAEEMKAALDLARNGASAALVWNLYPNVLDGVTYRTWALVDDAGPTNAYWPFKALSPNIPEGSHVLGVQKSNVKATIDSLGYAAFQSGNVVVVGMANPSPANLVVSLDVGGASGWLVTKLDSFTPTGLVESIPQNLRRGACAMTVSLPGDPAAANAGSGVVISLLLKPVITQQPAASTTVKSGTPVTLSVGATLDPGVRYQWKKSGKAIAGATGSAYAFVAKGKAGTQQSYTVTVTNAAGSAGSEAAVVQID